VSPFLAFPALWLGLLAGGQHAVQGPDHFAGVAPFAAQSGRSAWRVGIAWGFGHASGAAAAACMALILRAWIPGVEEHLSNVSDRIVGVLLCFVGALGLRAALQARVDERLHAHGGVVHAHMHFRPFAFLERRGKNSAQQHNHDQRKQDQHRHSACVLGLFHGAGGLSHIFAVLPALGFPGVALPALYLAGYAVGSLVLITAFATGVGHIAPTGRLHWQRRVMIAASALSVGVGLVWIVHPL